MWVGERCWADLCIGLTLVAFVAIWLGQPRDWPARRRTAGQVATVLAATGLTVGLWLHLYLRGYTLHRWQYLAAALLLVLDLINAARLADAWLAHRAEQAEAAKLWIRQHSLEG